MEERKKLVIEKLKKAVVQIATPYSTGTGFCLSHHQIIITNEHVIRGNKEVVILGPSIEKQLAQVLYIDTNYDLAFLKLPTAVDLPAIDLGLFDKLEVGESVLAIGHPFGLKYTATQGMISGLNYMQSNIYYIQHDAALNPGNSGGPLLDMDGYVIGVNTFIIQNGNNIGFSLPVSYLEEAIKDFQKGGGEPGIKCESCRNIIFESQVTDKYCPRCGAKIQMLSTIEYYEAVGVARTIEEMLEELGYDVPLTRRGPDNWQINQGSAIINVSYHEKTGMIVGDAYLCRLPKEDIKPLYQYLLRENYAMEGLTFSIKGQDIIISLLIFDQYLNVDSAKELFKHLFLAADKYDNILIEEFNATYKEEY